LEVLVTGETPAVLDFWEPFRSLKMHGKAGSTWKFVDTGQQPREALLASAQRAGVGLQEITGAGPTEAHTTLYDPGAVHFPLPPFVGGLSSGGCCCGTEDQPLHPAHR